MGTGMSKLRVEKQTGERAPRFCERPLGRALAVLMALQTAFAAPIASAAAAASAASGSVPPAAQQATGVGAVPAPSPAVVYNPAAIQQPVLAMPVPAFSGKPDKPLTSRIPTTADPGTLVPGGRRQTLTFADYGALDPLQLRGTDGQNGIAFSVRGDEVVTGAILHLIYSYSPSLLPSISQLKVLINGEVAATLPVPRDQAGVLVARDVAIDPRFITEFNHLNVQLIGHYTQQCEDPSSSTLWATVSNASSLDLTYASIANKPDLAALAAAVLRPPRRAPPRTAVRVRGQAESRRAGIGGHGRVVLRLARGLSRRDFSRRRPTTCRCRAMPWCSPPAIRRSRASIFRRFPVRPSRSSNATRARVAACCSCSAATTTS